MGVLGFPEATAAEDVAEGAVGEDVVLADSHLLLGDEHPAVELGGVGEESGESGFEGAFVLDVLVGVGLQRLVVLLSSVSTKQRPSNASYSSVCSQYACSMFMAAM